MNPRITTLLTLLALAFPATAQELDLPSPDMDLDGPGESMDMQSMNFDGGVCAANMQVNYYQEDKDVHVASTLTNDQCGPSSGDYTIRVRYRNEDGELKSREFDETWERDHTEPLELAHEYTIGKEAEVVRVTSTAVTCECEGEKESEDSDEDD